MNLRLMLKLILKRVAQVMLLASVALFGQSAFGSSVMLQGQNKGDTNNWYAGNLNYWAELDYIPCRVHFENSQGSNQTITIYFEHYKNGIPGIQNLFYWSGSSNVVFTAGPTLSAPPSATTWSYTFTINILDSQPAEVWYFARLAAGAHVNPGSSLTMSGNPSSMGNLQIHKPAAAPGAPDLSLVKTGPTSVAPGEVIIYTLNYSSKTNSAATATCVQVSDILPATVTFNPGSLPTNAVLVGNTIYWDLPNLAVGTNGVITFQVQVNTNTPYSYSFTNTAQIFSAENDQDYSDNTAIWITTTISCTKPAVSVTPFNAAK